MTKQFNVVPSKPATVTVHPTLGIGDATTIQDGIDLLPAEGGIVLVREGVYAIVAAIALSDKNIVLQGSGPGATIIDIGANVIAGISFGFDRNYRVSNLTIRGSGAVGQRAFEFSAAITCTQLILIENCETGNPGYTSVIETVFVTVAGGFPCVAITDCLFRLPSTVTALMVNGQGFFDIEYTECHDGAFGFYDGGTAGDPNIYALSCIFGFRNNMAVFLGYFENCTFNGNGILIPASIYTTVIACTFNGSTIPNPTRFIQDVTLSLIMGNSFSDCAAETVSVLGDGSRIIGNDNCKVTESGAFTGNDYDDNTGFSLSVIPGILSRVEGSNLYSDATDAPFGAFFTLFTKLSIKGLFGIGTIKRTGGVGTMEVRETVIDAFGVTDALVTTLIPGADYKLDAQKNIGTARPPYLSYAVAVQRLVVGSPATYDLKFASQGWVK